jgi:hypothetical protein
MLWMAMMMVRLEITIKTSKDAQPQFPNKDLLAQAITSFLELARSALMDII